jgi:hypothetical protein
VDAPLHPVIVQAEAEQVVLATLAVLGQVLPQPLQLFGSLVVFASQPLLALPSQLARPAPQVGEQVPPTQAVLPPELVHWVPQAPQLFTLLEVLVSHPLRVLPSQSPEPLAHTGTHCELLHEVLPLVFVQAWPQAPQLPVLVRVSVSQPLRGLPSQSEKPGAQTGAQVPLEHEVLPCGLTQPRLQPPQLLTLVSTLVSQPFGPKSSQLPKPALHTGTHCEATQALSPLTGLQTMPQPPQLLPLLVVLGQVLPQPLQLFGSLVVFASQPLLALPSQLALPGLQPIWQVPPAQDTLPLGLVHTLPQPPQLETSVLLLVSQPLRGLPSQSDQPGAQVGTHCELLQTVDPWSLVQRVPQPPQ